MFFSGGGEGDECNFGHIKFEMPVGQSTGDVE